LVKKIHQRDGPVSTSNIPVIALSWAGSNCLRYMALLALLILAAPMNDGWAADSERSWQTPKMTLLDRPEFINKTVQLMNGGIPGMGKEYDAQKISDDLVAMIFGELQDPSGIHAETALATLGALAGFAGQMAIRETLVKPGKMREDEAFKVVKAKNGETYYTGDLLNEILFASQPGNFSIDGQVTEAARQAGAKELPDAKDIASDVARVMGTGAFGVPRVPPEHMPKTSPIQLLDKFWNPVRNYLVVSVSSPPQWPLVIGLAAQKVIIKAKDAIDPGVAAKLVTEAAIAMAEVDPAKVHFAYFQSY
jgi:hypothetical protein